MTVSSVEQLAAASSVSAVSVVGATCPGTVFSRAGSGIRGTLRSRLATHVSRLRRFTMRHEARKPDKSHTSEDRRDVARRLWRAHIVDCRLVLWGVSRGGSLGLLSGHGRGG